MHVGDGRNAMPTTAAPDRGQHHKILMKLQVLSARHDANLHHDLFRKALTTDSRPK